MEKSNKKYKEPADKKRREKLFEEDMMMVYIRREEISGEKSPYRAAISRLELEDEFF